MVFVGKVSAKWYADSKDVRIHTDKTPIQVRVGSISSWRSFLVCHEMYLCFIYRTTHIAWDAINNSWWHFYSMSNFVRKQKNRKDATYSTLFTHIGSDHHFVTRNNRFDRFSFQWPSLIVNTYDITLIKRDPNCNYNLINACTNFAPIVRISFDHVGLFQRGLIVGV